MRNYPYFISDAIVLLLLLAVIPAVSLYSGYGSWIAITSILIFFIYFQSSITKIKDFERSVKNIKGIRSWESNFFSFGTLFFDYKGERLSYQSMLRGKRGNHISVDYVLDAVNKSKKQFEMKNEGRGWLNEFSVSGDEKFLSSMKKDIVAFNKKYRIEKMKNDKGVLHMVVNLRFMPGKPPSKKEKLEDMSQFLQDYLELTSKINKRLRTRR